MAELRLSKGARVLSLELDPAGIRQLNIVVVILFLDIFLVKLAFLRPHFNPNLLSGTKVSGGQPKMANVTEP